MFAKKTTAEIIAKKIRNGLLVNVTVGYFGPKIVKGLNQAEKKLVEFVDQRNEKKLRSILKETCFIK